MTRPGGTILLLFLFLLSLLPGCGKDASAPPDKGKGSGPTPVITTPVTRKEIPVTIRNFGHAEACATVAIKSRIDGALQQVHVQEGAEVAAGELLFSIDDRLPALELQQRQAQLAHDRAQLELARLQEQRQRELKRQDWTSRENLDQTRATRTAAEATVAASEAAVNAATVQLTFTRIHAPMAGRTGRLQLHPGNLVRANDATPLLTLHQTDPMCVTFAMPERHLAQATPGARVQVRLPGQTEPVGEGKVTLLDNAADRATGTLSLKAQVPNPQRRLLPGLYLEVETTLTTLTAALVVPAPALVSSPQGRAVYVVKGDTAEFRPVTVAWEDAREAALAQGVDEGEAVVTVGQWRLAPGAKVRLEDAGGKGMTR